MATSRYFGSTVPVLTIKLLQIICEANVARRDFSFFVLDDGINGKKIVLNQFVSHREHFIQLLEQIDRVAAQKVFRLHPSFTDNQRQVWVILSLEFLQTFITGV